MRGEILFLCMIVLCSSIVLADEMVTIYDGWISYGEELDIDDEIFFIGGQSTLDNFIVNLPDGESIIFSGPDCKADSLWRICYNGSKELDWVNYTLDKEYWKGEFVIEKLEIDAEGIEVRKTFAYKSPVFINDPVYVTIKLRNNATGTAEGIVLKDQISDSFVVSNAMGCEYFGTNIRWYGNLKTEETHTCKYTLTAKEDSSFGTAAVVEYILDNVERTSKTESENISISIPYLKTNIFVSDQFPKVGEMLFYSINMTNIDTDELLFVNRLLIEVPKHIEVIQYHPKLKQERFGLSFKGIIGEDETLQLWLLGKPLIAINFSMDTSIDYTIRKIAGDTELGEDIYVQLSANGSLGNVSLINWTMDDYLGGLDNLTEVDNVAELGNLTEIDNVAIEASLPEQPILQKPEDKKSIPLLIVFGILVFGVIGFGVYRIKKSREVYF